ncbi:MAG: type II secretion system secretin GspD [Myxococcales bacterium]|nr:type II secretion system secretin GspD [Myxococcales bacterium]
MNHQTPLRTSINASLLCVVITLGGALPAAAQPGGRTSPTRPPGAGGRAEKQALDAAEKPVVSQPSTASSPTGGSSTSSAALTPAVGEDETLYSCKKAKGSITISFKPESELKDLITWAMSFTCKNFIYEAGILARSKKVTIISPLKMSPQDAYRVFLLSLSSMGLTVVPKGNVLRIVEAAQAKGETLPIFRKGTPGNSDEVVRAIMRPTHIGVSALSDAISVVKSSVGDIKVLPDAGAIIVTDYASHIRDMASIAREIDRPSASNGIYTMRINNGDVKDIVAKLNEILGPSPAAGAAGAAGGRGTATRGGGAEQFSVGDVETALPTKILADERTNTLILVTNDAGYHRVRGLVQRLDVALPSDGTGSVHVYSVKHGNAEDLATTIKSALTGQSQPSRRSGTTTPATSTAGPQRNVPVQAPTPAAAGGDGAAFEGQVQVTHDSPTNSLVVVASERDYMSLRRVLDKLDTPRRQVYIEAVIMEVSVGSGRDLGTSFHGGLPTGSGNDSLVLGGLQAGSVKSIQPSSLASASGLIGGIIGPLLPESEKLLGTSIPSFGVLVQALGTTKNANLLSSPQLLTVDNEPAEWKVGSNIPYVGSITFGGAGTGATSPFGSGQQNVQRQPLTLEMKVTPHISADESVRLEVEINISDQIGETSIGGLPQPIWSERKLKNVVNVNDRSPAVLSGFISEKTIYSDSKVPLLGDIPILGYLFKVSSKKKEKTNLLVVLTPYIVTSDADLREIYRRKMEERTEFLRQFGSFQKMKYMPKADYGRKRGLIEEMNRTVQEVEREDAVIRAFETQQLNIPDGAIQYDTSPVEGDVELEGAAATPTPTPGKPTEAPKP